MASAATEEAGRGDWPRHVVRASDHRECPDEVEDPERHRERIEPWLSALLQAEHLSLLIGSGFTTAVAASASAPPVDMSPTAFRPDYADAVGEAARESAVRLGRFDPNIEDQVRTVIELIGGLRILAGRPEAEHGADPLRVTASRLLADWRSELDNVLSSLLGNILATEGGIETVLAGPGGQRPDEVRRLLGGFLLPFGSRVATRERTHIFTLNYDRLVEYGCDLLGLRIVDRFVGTLAPVFHSTRLGVDLHYNPPGIRGDPNGEYAEAFQDLGVRLFRVDPRDKDGNPLHVPAWLWNGAEWSAFTDAAPGVQRPLLLEALRRLRSGLGPPEQFDTDAKGRIKRYQTRLRMLVQSGDHQAPGRREGCADVLLNIHTDFTDLARSPDCTDPDLQQALETVASRAMRNLSTTLRHRRFLFTDSFLLLWKWRVG